MNQVFPIQMVIVIQSGPDKCYQGPILPTLDRQLHIGADRASPGFSSRLFSQFRGKVKSKNARKIKTV